MMTFEKNYPVTLIPWGSTVEETAHQLITYLAIFRFSFVLTTPSKVFQHCARTGYCGRHNKVTLGATTGTLSTVTSMRGMN